MAPPRNQSVSFLIRRFREAGIRPHARHGQNFLVDRNLLELLVQAAKIEPADVVLEVGTGTGALTALLARQAAHVVSCEIDPQIAQLAAEELAGTANISLLRLDVLHNKNRLNPLVLDAVRRQLEQSPGGRFLLAANLPYNVATPLISNLLAADAVPHSMTVTIQRELADRILARPGTKDYSALTAWLQVQCRVEMVRMLPPQVFWPRPKVHSAIVRIEVDPALRSRAADLEHFHGFVRRLFLHRRKRLRGVLAAMFKHQPRDAVDAVLAAAGLAAECRAEQLDVETLLALSEQCRPWDAASPAAE